VEFEPTASMPVIPYEEKNVSTAPSTEAQPAEPSFAENVAPFLQRVLRCLAPWPRLFVFGSLWIGYDSFRIARLDPSQTVATFVLAIPPPRPTRDRVRFEEPNSPRLCICTHCSNPVIHERFPRVSKIGLCLLNIEIEQLTELFSRSLFSPLPPTRAEADNAQ
jgi:hypothetical protein